MSDEQRRAPRGVEKTLTDDEKRSLTTLVGRVFSPSAPIESDKLFAGRLRQIRLITEAINSRGRHAILYGDRGVGKTSLVSILRPLYSGQAGVTIAKVNCVESDKFASVWRRVLDDVRIPEEDTGPDGKPAHTWRKLSDYVDVSAPSGPGEIRQILQYASQEDWELVLIFDEFDRLPDSERGLFADTIKDLSDNSIKTTLVLVGVAPDVVSLIKEHNSIDRCLTQILLQRMTPEELKDIIDRALAALKMSIDAEAAQLVLFLSQGLPHFTHLLGQEAAHHAIGAGRPRIVLDDVRQGIAEAVEKSQQSVRNDYYNATRGQRSGTLFPQVLLACALATTDEMGFFGSADVRSPLCRITHREYDIPNFSQHLDKFSADPSRGPVLEKSGTTRRFKFRFRNPLLQPFIIMKGLQDGVITGEIMGELMAKKPTDHLFAQPS